MTASGWHERKEAAVLDPKSRRSIRTFGSEYSALWPRALCRRGGCSAITEGSVWWVDAGLTRALLAASGGRRGVASASSPTSAMGAPAPSGSAAVACASADPAAAAPLANRDNAVAAGASSPPAPAPRWVIPHACGPVSLGGGRYRFRVWAPHGEDVELELEGRAAAPMARVGDFWEAEVAVSPGDRYRLAMGSSWNDCFQAEGARLLRRDPCAREVDFDGDWCVVPKPPAARPPAAVPLPGKEELVIYEMHLGTWVPPEAEEAGEVFLAATQALEYVAALGFNCVQLMPVVEFGGLWGYNPRQLMAVHGPWGSADQLRGFIERAHDLGIGLFASVCRGLPSRSPGHMRRSGRSA